MCVLFFFCASAFMCASACMRVCVLGRYSRVYSVYMKIHVHFMVC